MGVFALIDRCTTYHSPPFEVTTHINEYTELLLLLLLSVSLDVPHHGRGVQQGGDSEHLQVPDPSPDPGPVPQVFQRKSLALRQVELQVPLRQGLQVRGGQVNTSTGPFTC